MRPPWRGWRFALAETGQTHRNQAARGRARSPVRLPRPLPNPSRSHRHPGRSPPVLPDSRHAASTYRVALPQNRQCPPENKRRAVQAGAAPTLADLAAIGSARATGVLGLRAARWALCYPPRAFAPRLGPPRHQSPPSPAPRATAGHR
ncbi:hypothetical protein GUJ93_ZPchr0007g4114 [Zizania palustris]|uniref:Uncharacterized protein n=1 Tax=Zizania palustris TaxID=103762 RepID=A0A8J5SJB3_ZIZPA|nr:hypothetical protein GUJ93_ZPchr0007g4114 [Zizania palustris]